jgi:hypothetical protein
MAVGTCLALLVVGVVSGQGQRSPATIDDLLIELRGLRGDLNQLSGTSVRAQLLVGRLQLQEARINTLGRDLTDIRQRLTGQATVLARLREEANRIEESVRTGDFPAAERPNIERMLKDRQSELLRTQRDDQAMRSQEAEIAALLAAEQGRWSDFNSLLDELERTLATSR